MQKIVERIKADWKNVHYTAAPYLAAMSCMDSIDDVYINESGRSIVTYFLSNASSWRGPVARQIKKELRELCSK